MAEITGNGVSNSGGYYKHSWPDLSNGDTGKPINLSLFRGASVQVVGTFGTGGQVDIEGSNDGGTTWDTLTNEQGTAINLTDTSLEEIQQYAELVRPNVSAGDTNTSLTVHLVARKPA